MPRYGMTLGEYIFSLVQKNLIGSEEWETLVRLYGIERLRSVYRKHVYGDSGGSGEIPGESQVEQPSLIK